MTNRTFRSAFSHVATVICLVAAVVFASPLGTGGRSFAAPPALSLAAPTPTEVGPAAVTITSTETAVPLKGTFGYRATVRTKTELEYVQVRMRLFMSSGSLVYQKTHVDAKKSAKTRTFEFSRSIADLDLAPGIYPIEISVRVSSKGKVAEQIIPASLNVYDPEAKPRDVVLGIRVSALPLRDPSGRFIADPASYVRARNDVTALAEHVLANPDARLTVALSPLMLEEWLRITKGYHYETPEGAIEVAADDATPQAYNYTLSQLSEALATGRMEIMSLGYSDPDLFRLAEAGLADDIAVQYAIGSSSVTAALHTTPTATTAPAGGCISGDIAKRLSDAGIGRIFVSDRCVTRATPGTFKMADSTMTVMVADSRLASSLAASSTAECMALIFGRTIKRPTQPLPVILDVGPRGVAADQVIAISNSIARTKWVRSVMASDVAASTAKRSKAKLTSPGSMTPAPRGHWQEVASARRSAQALIAALGPKDEDAMRAARQSLVAESSTWAGISNDWSQAQRGIAYASDALMTADEVFGAVTLSSKPVTLAGTRGRVPVTISNGSDRAVIIRLSTAPSSAMRKGLSPVRPIKLQPGDNFVEIPVDLQGGLSGTLAVSVLAGDMELARTTVPLKASIIDRLVMLGGTILVLGGLLAFIFTRMRAAESADTVRGTPRDGTL